MNSFGRTFFSIEKSLTKTLKESFRFDLADTRKRYNELGALLFFGVGLVSLTGLVFVPAYDSKIILYAYTGYCFFFAAVVRFRPPGFTLGYSILNIPLGLSMIVSVQAIAPLYLLYMTSFLYPIVFIFAYEFHHRYFVRSMLLLSLFSTGAIVAWRGLPYWQTYLTTTFGATLIVGNVVAAAMQRIQVLANYDALTGLFNRRHWEETLTPLIRLAQREKRPFSLIFFDLDNFKRINDTHGHAAGDRLLKTVAGHLLEACRESDLLGRLGGDEFAIAMPNTSHEEAMNVIRRLRVNMNETDISAGSVTMRPGESLDELIVRADQAMYQDKSRRRKAIPSGNQPQIADT